MIRNPLRRMPRGITKATSSARGHGLFRNKYEARILVTKSTQLERIPLHSWATSITMLGDLNKRPSRRNGVPEMLKNRSAASAEASLEAVSSKSTARSGRGTMKRRKAMGKVAAASHLRPIKRKPPEARRQTNESVISARKSLWLIAWSAPCSVHPTINAAKPAAKGIIAKRGEDSYSLGNRFRWMQMR